MVTPSASKLGSVNFTYSYPLNSSLERELLETDEEKTELCDATNELLAGFGYLREVDMNFCNGSVTLTAESQENSKHSGTILLDVMAIQFFQDNKEYIAEINPPLAHRIENNVLTKDVRQISDIFYRTYQRYLKDQTDEDGLDEGVERNTIKSSEPGFKNFNCYSHYAHTRVTSLNILEGAAGENFKKCIQTLPKSLLSPKGFKKAALFLQVGIDQKISYSDKLLYLRQVLFLLTFQDAFKNLLQNMQQQKAIEKRVLYNSPNRNHDLSPYSLCNQMRSESLEATLSSLPVNDIALLIPLACRSSLHELSQDGDFLESGNNLSESYLARECSNAVKADLAIRNLLSESFHIVPKSRAVKKDDYFDEDGIKSIESYFMGISGLAISPGLMGRLAMRDHHTIYYQRDLVMNIPHVSDDLPVEFLLTAAQFYPDESSDWVEEKCLGYIHKMIGKISLNELQDIKSIIRNVCRAVHRAPVEELLKQESTHRYLVRNSAIQKLHSLYKIAREQAGLPPLRDTTSSCSIIM